MKKETKKERIYWRSIQASREYVDGLRETDWPMKTKPKMNYRDLQEERGTLNYKVFKKSCIERLLDFRKDAYDRYDNETAMKINIIIKKF